jgi:GNAT superfamily N-acetyltransferase
MMAQLEDVITYLEMFARPAPRPLPMPSAKHAVMQVERCPAGFYRYLYNTVGEPWLWFERRLVGDATLAALLARPTIELFVLYVGGVPAGFFELDTAAARETKLCYFGLAPDFIGRGFGPNLLQAAIDRAWSARPIQRLWLHTSRFDHPKALGVYQRAGFAAYQRQPVTFADPRLAGILPRSLTHPLLPPLD